jgi:hypothetical protein
MRVLPYKSVFGATIGDWGIPSGERTAVNAGRSASQLSELSMIGEPSAG